MGANPSPIPYPTAFPMQELAYLRTVVTDPANADKRAAVHCAAVTADFAAGIIFGNAAVSSAPEPETLSPLEMIDRAVASHQIKGGIGAEAVPWKLIAKTILGIVLQLLGCLLLVLLFAAPSHAQQAPRPPQAPPMRPELCPCVVGDRCTCGEVCPCSVVRVTWERPRMGDSLRRKDVDGSWWAYSPTRDVWQCCETAIVRTMPLPQPTSQQYQSMQFAQPMMAFGSRGSGGSCAGGS